jgi:hypothetical protein
MKSPMDAAGVMRRGGSGPFQTRFHGAWTLLGEEGGAVVATGEVVAEDDGVCRRAAVEVAAACRGTGWTTHCDSASASPRSSHSDSESEQALLV